MVEISSHEKNLIEVAPPIQRNIVTIQMHSYPEAEKNPRYWWHWKKARNGKNGLFPQFA
jgi:hypothetical protein